MPTPISTSSFSTQFNLTVSPSKFLFTDTFNYGAYGISNNQVKNCFTIYAPGGQVVYSNNNFNAPDINRGTSAVNTTNIFLPLLSTGAPVPGTYVIDMTTQVSPAVGPAYYVTTRGEHKFNFVAPTICISQTVDCIGGNFTSSDITNYVVDGIVPVVVRTHEVAVPAGNPAPTVTTGTTPIVTLGSGNFYNGLQTTTITSVCTWTYPDGSVVTATLTGTKSIAVDCTYFCAIYCCLRTINSNIKKYKGVNDMLAAQYEATFAQVMGLVELATLAYSCGKSGDVSGYLNQIQNLADCTEDCSCKDGAPSPVYGLGGGGSGVTVVTSCNPNVISVTPTTVGNTTTYEICLDEDLVTKINGLKNTVVVAGDSSVTVTPSGPVGAIPTMTYSIVSNYVEPDILSFKAKIVYDRAAPYITMTILDAQKYGSLFKLPTVLNTLTTATPGSANWNGSNARFYVNNFINTSTTPPKFKVAMSFELYNNLLPLYIKPIDIAMYTSGGVGRIDFSLLGSSAIAGSSSPVTHGSMTTQRSDVLNTIIVHFTLTTY